MVCCVLYCTGLPSWWTYLKSLFSEASFLSIRSLFLLQAWASLGKLIFIVIHCFNNPIAWTMECLLEHFHFWHTCNRKNPGGTVEHYAMFIHWIIKIKYKVWAANYTIIEDQKGLNPISLSYFLFLDFIISIKNYYYSQMA